MVIIAKSLVCLIFESRVLSVMQHGLPLYLEDQTNGYEHNDSTIARASDLIPKRGETI